MSETKTKKKEISENASTLGRLGGKAVVKKHGKAYMQKIGRRGMKARWGKKVKNKK